MTDKEWLQSYLEKYKDDKSDLDFLVLLDSYLNEQHKTDYYELELMQVLRFSLIGKLNNITAILQQLWMTKKYLEGKMYKDEEEAKKMLPKQIENLERILKIFGWDSNWNPNNRPVVWGYKETE